MWRALVRPPFLRGVEGSSRAVAFPTRPSGLGVFRISQSPPGPQTFTGDPVLPPGGCIPRSLGAGQTSLPTGTLPTSRQLFVALTHLMSMRAGLAPCLLYPQREVGTLRMLVLWRRVCHLPSTALDSVSGRGRRQPDSSEGPEPGTPTDEEAVYMEGVT